jgi:hypothetical protein
MLKICRVHVSYIFEMEIAQIQFVHQNLVTVAPNTVRSMFCKHNIVSIHRFVQKSRNLLSSYLIEI